jgi:Na+-transporting NADH:ubiquinone oxidoreductase subunit F
MANFPAEKNLIKLNIRIATPPWDRTGISSLMSLRVYALPISFTKTGRQGDDFRSLWRIPYKNTGNEMIYIGGGAGYGSSQITYLPSFHTLKTNRKVSYCMEQDPCVRSFMR